MAHCPRHEMKGLKWKLRRMVDNIADFIQKGTNVQYSETSDALSRLLQAVGKEVIPARNSRHLPRTVKWSAEGKIPKGPSRKHYQRWLRIKDENEKLRAKLASHTAARAGGELHLHGLDRANFPGVAGSERPRPDAVLPGRRWP